MNFNSKNISALLILISFCFITFLSCKKKVTRENQFEYYTGTAEHFTWNYTPEFNTVHSGISDVTIQHIGNKIGNKKDIIKVTLVIWLGYSFVRTLNFIHTNTANDSYEENPRDAIPGEQAHLSKDRLSKKITLHFGFSNDDGGYDIYFSGEQK